jgi:hypothetical protein
MEATVIAVMSALVAAVAAVAATLQVRLVRKQTKYAEDVAIATLYHRTGHQFVELDRFFVDHPELRPFFYSGAHVPKDILLKNQIEACAEMLFDLAEVCHANHSVLKGTAKDWDRYFSFIYTNSPALREYSESTATCIPWWFSEPLCNCRKRELPDQSWRQS